MSTTTTQSVARREAKASTAPARGALLSEEAGVVATRGLSVVPQLRGAAVRSGVKESGELDLALIVADEPMIAAGVFTRNEMAAAPVRLSRLRLHRDPRIRAIVINAGNANALTGTKGRADAERMIRETESACGAPAVVLSTGIIGVPLPIDRVCGGIREAATALSPEFEPDVPRAIRTTDTTDKIASTQIDAGGRTCHCGGVAKGSGMIHPNMATMLAVVATDAPIAAGELNEILIDAVDESFHRISVDGDTSTNDAVLLLARSPESGAPLLSCAERAEVAAGVTRVCRSLAEQIVADGEGASRVMTIEVRGGSSKEDARAVASSIARSSLVKTALAGGDPNWGRILSAAGNAGVAVDVERVALAIGDQTVFARGSVWEVDRAALERAFSGSRVSVALDLGAGSAHCRQLTTDLTADYVAINSEYST